MSEPTCTDDALLAELRRVAGIVDPPPPSPDEGAFARWHTHRNAGDGRDNPPAAS